MQYADSTGLTLIGGVGECIHSDGSIIDVFMGQYDYHSQI